MGRRKGWWASTVRQNEILAKAFEAANLREVPEEKLLPGQLTNKKIIRRLRNHHVLLTLLLNLPRDENPSVRRSALSEAVRSHKRRR